MYSIREKILSIIFFSSRIRVVMETRVIYIYINVFRRDNGHVLNIKMGGRKKFKKRREYD